jgi:hypothetical protein
MRSTDRPALPPTARIRARAFIAVAAWLPTIGEFATMLDRGPGRDLSAYIVVGGRDPAAMGRSSSSLSLSRAMAFMSA